MSIRVDQASPSPPVSNPPPAKRMRTHSPTPTTPTTGRIAATTDNANPLLQQQLPQPPQPPQVPRLSSNADNSDQAPPAPSVPQTNGETAPSAQPNLEEEPSEPDQPTIGDIEHTVLGDAERLERFNKYLRLRNLVRSEYKGGENFTRTEINKKYFASGRHKPEPDTLELLSICLAKAHGDDDADSVLFRSVAEKLRFDPRTTLEDLEDDPIEQLEYSIGSPENDFNLITSSESTPTYDFSSRAHTAVPGKPEQNYMFVNLRIELDPATDVQVSAQEVVAEAHEVCDKGEIEPVLERKWRRLKTAAVIIALRKLRLLVGEAQESRAVSEDEFEGLLTTPTDELYELVGCKDKTPTGAYALFLKKETSAPVFRSLRGADGEQGVQLTVKFDVYATAVQLPEKCVVERSRESTADMRSALSRKRHEKLMHHASREMIAKIHAVADRITTQAAQTLKQGVQDRLGTFKKQNAASHYITTLERVRELVCAEAGGDFYGFKLSAFGSVPAELALEDSDLDVCIRLPDEKHLLMRDTVDRDEVRVHGTTPAASKPTPRIVRKYPNDLARNVVYHLRKHMRAHGMLLVRAITSARVPVLKFYDPDTGVQVDLTVDNTDGTLQCMLLRNHLRADERVHQLAILIRHWAKQRGVCGLMDGFINPLGWTVMAIFFLQHGTYPPIAGLFEIHHPTKHVAKDARVRPRKWDSATMEGTNHTEISRLLVHFFEFYLAFNYEENVISLSNQDVEKKKHAGNSKEIGASAAITIQQPLLPDKNMVGYVSQVALDETLVEMKSAHYRLSHLGDKWDSQRDPEVDDMEYTDEDDAPVGDQ